jgi:hypothetical protein
MEEKECLNCKKIFPVSSFHKEKSGYVRGICCSCRLTQTQLSRQKRKDSNKVIPSTKECNRCKIIKPSSDFNKFSLSSDGLAKDCRECFKKHRYRKKTSNETEVKSLCCEKCQIVKPNTEFRTTKRSTTGYFKTCNACWKPREWNSEKQKLSEKKYLSNNRDKIRMKWKKAALNPHRIIRDRLNHRIADALRAVNTRKGNKTATYLGCSIPFLKKWFEFHFSESMTWQNYGDWHIDHVKPCSSYDILKNEEQMECFNWKNLRPCLGKENLEKSNKLIPKLIEQQKEMVSKFLKINPLPTQPGDRVGGAE